jgi:hypothetical protein
MTMRRLIAAICALLASASLAFGQAANPADPVKFLSAATNNSTLVRTGPVVLLQIVAVNTTATIEFLKFYDKTTAPTCGTDTPLWTVPLLISTVAPTIISPPAGIRFFNGLGFCLTGGIADNDNTNAATGVAINLGIR